MPLNDSPHGPVLRSARDALCAAGLAAGVTLVLVEEWEALAELNDRHRGDWFPLLPRPAAAQSFWVAEVNADGEFVATHGVVLLDCSAASFGARVGDLTAFHDPGAAPSEEFGFCASPAAHKTCGAVAWIVAGWNRPDWRGRGLFHLLGAVARLVALDRWSPRWVVGLVDPETVPVWVRRCAGRALLEPMPAVLYQQAGVGRLPLHFMRWSRPAVLLDLQDAAQAWSMQGLDVDGGQNGTAAPILPPIERVGVDEGPADTRDGHPVEDGLAGADALGILRPDAVGELDMRIRFVGLVDDGPAPGAPQHRQGRHPQMPEAQRLGRPGAGQEGAAVHQAGTLQEGREGRGQHALAPALRHDGALPILRLGERQPDDGGLRPDGGALGAPVLGGKGEDGHAARSSFRASTAAA
ncbi:hypothetical protein [Azospirillum sp. Sh1]|uniref:hypothetical protein n=1 Tax=Azospirillum sp. Sh1 TaxID=2607285 RepID=UPI0011EEB6BC|nr:hypothetical protein [Azospirillum sp. Sh1]KAA0582680.1 hypothetical protein FZ029_00885 [Azospirillum sp. Sh1]